MSAPNVLADWANNPQALSSANEQQTLALNYVPASGSFVLALQSQAGAPVQSVVINWNDSLSTIVSKVNGIFAAGGVTGTGSLASQSVVLDFGTFSQTTFVPIITINSNGLLNAGGVAISVTPSITQASQLPQIVSVDSGHSQNGFIFGERPAFNIFNSWMNTVGQWIRSFNKGPNLCINGAMAVAQSGTSGTITGGTSGYTLDGFIAGSVGANLAWSQISSANKNYLQLAPAGTLTDLFVKQRIESIDLAQIGYPTITFQAKVVNNTLGTITPTLALNVPTVADNYGSVVSALAATSLQPIATGQSATLAYTFVLSNAFNFQNGLEAILDFGASVGSGVNVQVTDWDISITPSCPAGLNSFPPIFKTRSYKEEFNVCQNYFQVWGGDAASQVIADGFNTSSLNPILFLPYKSNMRTIPTLSYSQLSDFLVLDGTTSPPSPNSMTLLKASKASTFILCPVSSGFAQGAGAYLQTNSTTNARLYLSARL